MAIVAVVDIALHARPAAVSAKSLAARHGLAPRQLETVLQALVRNGILTSARGPRGGYALARERRRIAIGEIVLAVVAGEAEPEQSRPDESGLLGEIVLPALAMAGDAYRRALDRISVEDLCREAGGGVSIDRSIDFTI